MLSPAGEDRACDLVTFRWSGGAVGLVTQLVHGLRRAGLTVTLEEDDLLCEGPWGHGYVVVGRASEERWGLQLDVAPEALDRLAAHVAEVLRIAGVADSARWSRSEPLTG